MHLRTMMSSLMIPLFVALSLSVVAADKTEVKGMITARTGETLIVKTTSGIATVVLTDETKTKDNTGLFGLERKYMSNVVLIPGLKVDIDGVMDEQGRVIATTITVDGDDLETSEMIQAGLHPTAEQVRATRRAIEGNSQNIAANRQGINANQRAIAESAQGIAANKQQIDQNIRDIQQATDRFTQLSEYDVKGQATVKFDVGRSEMSTTDMDQLKQLANDATKLTGYIIEVTGYTDSSGSAQINQKLSEDRAQAVIAYLIQQCGIPVRHVVAPGAMGEYQPAASNETREGRAENRRVEVKVLVNRGITGG